MFHAKSVYWAARMPNLDKLCNSFHAVGINGFLDFSLFLLAACDSECGQGSKNCNYPRRVSLLGGEAQLVGYLRELEGCLLEWDVGIG